MIEVGDIYKMPTGEGLRIEKYDYPEGEFLAQMRNMSTGEWTEFRLQGDAIKLPMFLKQQGAVKEN